jgi:hypothetical protein
LTLTTLASEEPAASSNSPIVPGGGFSLDQARWVASRSNFLVHVNVLARLFRGKMLAMLMDAVNTSQVVAAKAQSSAA